MDNQNTQSARDNAKQIGQVGQAESIDFGSGSITIEKDAISSAIISGNGNRVVIYQYQVDRQSVIVTLRSDFLGETQKHPVLNRLFAHQGFLVPTMDEEELRQAIRQPAEIAGHPLDKATIELLIKDTEGREGALPLLQFALTRIWEGLADGRESAETFKEIGGVGGALAGEAQRIYESLTPPEQELARRVFLGLVQLGEGTKDTRCRTEIKKVVSHRDSPEQVKQVIARFSAPGVRLITLAANANNADTAEVTHETLFEHWQQLKQWLDMGRSDIRFKRRLDEAAEHWDKNKRPEGNLWQSPDLDLLTSFAQKAGDEMTQLQREFFCASQSAKRRLHHNGNLSSGAGENIAASSNSVTEMVDMWGSEGKDYDYATNSCRGNTCGHYTQIVWRNTSELGCGVAPHKVYGRLLVCNYSPPGNYNGERPY